VNVKFSNFFFSEMFAQRPRQEIVTVNRLSENWNRENIQLGIEASPIIALVLPKQIQRTPKGYRTVRCPAVWCKGELGIFVNQFLIVNNKLFSQIEAESNKFNADIVGILIFPEAKQMNTRGKTIVYHDTQAIKIPHNVVSIVENEEAMKNNSHPHPVELSNNFNLEFKYRRVIANRN
jgi:hypothetical protein